MERRLAAILAADIVGYSRLMGVDEEGTLVRLRPPDLIRQAMVTLERPKPDNLRGICGETSIDDF